LLAQGPPEVNAGRCGQPRQVAHGGGDAAPVRGRRRKRSVLEQAGRSRLADHPRQRGLLRMHAFLQRQDVLALEVHQAHQVGCGTLLFCGIRTLAGKRGVARVESTHLGVQGVLEPR
jgi:hypothetical protein